MKSLIQFLESLNKEGIKPLACFQRNTKDDFEAVAPAEIDSSYWVDGLSKANPSMLEYKKENSQKERLRKYLILRQLIKSTLNKNDLAITFPSDIEIIIGDITSAEDPRQITKRLYREAVTRNDSIVGSINSYNSKIASFNSEVADEAKIEAIISDIAKLVHTLNIELEMSDAARIETTVLITDILLMQVGLYPIIPNVGFCQYLKDNLTETRPFPGTQEATEQCHGFADELLLALKNSCEIYLEEKMLISNIQNGRETGKTVKGFGSK